MYLLLEMMSREQISVPCRNGNAVVVIIIRFNQFYQDCHPRVNSIWQVDKEAFGILKIQAILSMHIQPFELFADDVSTGSGTITSCLFRKCIFTNLIFHFCQSECLCRCQMYLFCAFYVTSGRIYKRVPLAGH